MVPEIMIPLVGEVKELKYVKDVVVKEADALIAASGLEMKYLVCINLFIFQKITRCNTRPKFIR